MYSGFPDLRAKVKIIFNYQSKVIKFLKSKDFTAESYKVIKSKGFDDSRYVYHYFKTLRHSAL